MGELLGIHKARLLVYEVALEELSVLLNLFVHAGIGVNRAHIDRGRELESNDHPIIVAGIGAILCDQIDFDLIIGDPARSSDFIDQQVEILVGIVAALGPPFLDDDLQHRILEGFVALAEVGVELQRDTLLPAEAYAVVDDSSTNLEPPPVFCMGRRLSACSFAVTHLQFSGQ